MHPSFAVGPKRQLQAVGQNLAHGNGTLKRCEMVAESGPKAQKLRFFTSGPWWVCPGRKRGQGFNSWSPYKPSETYKDNHMKGRALRGCAVAEGPK